MCYPKRKDDLRKSAILTMVIPDVGPSDISKMFPKIA